MIGGCGLHSVTTMVDLELDLESQTFIEPDRWEAIRRKIYLPHDADEYKTSSRSLTALSQEIFLKSCPRKDKALKMGYMVDVCREGGVTPCALILSLIYLQRLSEYNPDYLSQLPSTHAFLTALVIASKYLQDEGEMEALVNSEWAEIGHCCKSLLDSLEIDFLNALDWQLFVSPQEYFSFVNAIQANISCMEAKSRGWWSYTDLISLWDVVDTRKTWITTGKQMTKTIGGSLAVYLVTFTALLSTSQTINMYLSEDTHNIQNIQDDLTTHTNYFHWFTETPLHFTNREFVVTNDDMILYGVFNNSDDTQKFKVFADCICHTKHYQEYMYYINGHHIDTTNQLIDVADDGGGIKHF